MAAGIDASALGQRALSWARCRDVLLGVVSHRLSLKVPRDGSWSWTAVIARVSLRRGLPLDSTLAMLRRMALAGWGLMSLIKAAARNSKTRVCLCGGTPLRGTVPLAVMAAGTGTGASFRGAGVHRERRMAHFAAGDGAIRLGDRALTVLGKNAHKLSLEWFGPGFYSW